MIRICSIKFACVSRCEVVTHCIKLFVLVCVGPGQADASGGSAQEHHQVAGNISNCMHVCTLEAAD